MNAIGQLASIGCFILTACSAGAASLSETFQQGVDLGKGANPTIQSGIRSGAAQSSVPHFQPTVPESSYFGSPGLGAAPASVIDACTRALRDGTPFDAQACKAVIFSQTNADVRPRFTIHPSDPLMTQSRAIMNDPAAIAGSIAGTYAGCTTQTVRSPDIFENRVCNEYRTLEHYSYEKTLSVTVTDNGLDCTYGSYLTPNPRILFIRPYVYVGAICAGDIRFMWTYGFSECNGTDASIFVPSVVPTADPQRMLVNLGCGGLFYLKGSCPDGNCAYQVGLPDINWICDVPCGEDCCGAGHYEDFPLASFAYRLPQRTYTIADNWINQCSAFEARLP